MTKSINCSYCFSVVQTMINCTLIFCPKNDYESCNKNENIIQ